MLDSWIVFMAVLFFMAVPLGLILLSLGLFNQSARVCSACGYDRAGLKPDAKCPECGSPATASAYREVLRNSWQVRLGLALLLIAGVPLIGLVFVLIRQLV